MLFYFGLSLKMCAFVGAVMKQHHFCIHLCTHLVENSKSDENQTAGVIVAHDVWQIYN